MTLPIPLGTSHTGKAACTFAAVARARWIESKLCAAVAASVGINKCSRPTMKTPVMIEEYVLLLVYGWLSMRSLLASNPWKALYWAGALIVTLAVVKGITK